MDNITQYASVKIIYLPSTSVETRNFSQRCAEVPSVEATGETALFAKRLPLGEGGFPSVGD